MFATNTSDPNNGPLLVSFKSSNGATNWIYGAAAGQAITMVEATPGNGLVATVSDSSGDETVMRFNSSGVPNTDSGTPTASNIQYFVGGMTWLSKGVGEGGALSVFTDSPISAADSVYVNTQSSRGNDAASNYSLVNPANQTTDVFANWDRPGDSSALFKNIRNCNSLLWNLQCVASG